MQRAILLGLCMFLYERIGYLGSYKTDLLSFGISTFVEIESVWMENITCFNRLFAHDYHISTIAKYGIYIFINLIYVFVTVKNKEVFSINRIECGNESISVVWVYEIIARFKSRR